MKYTSPALSFEDQADLLIRRGLSYNNSKMVKIIESVRYFRLGEYCSICKDDQGLFIKGATLKKIWQNLSQ